MYFLEDTHQYIIRDKEYKSFSYLKKLVEPYKDWDKIAETYAKKNKITIEEVQKKWDDKKVKSCERGTLLHLFKEDQAKEQEDKIVYFSEVKGDKKIIKDLKTLEDGWHLELCMYNHEYEACGTADKVFIETINGIRYIDIFDYKTNESIDLESFYNPRTKTYEMMTSPLNHLMNSNYWGYALQLSTYGYFMERYGYTVRKLQLIHIPLEEVKTKKDEKLIVVNHDNKKYKIKEETIYEVDYLKKEVVKLLNYFKYLKLKNRLPEQIKK
jgi:hypothetical protein